MGFTLIELLVVVGVIAVLIAIVVPSVMMFQKKARRAAIMQTMATISTGLQGYFNDFNQYPPSNPGSGSYAAMDSGGKMLAAALLGTLPGQNGDGAGAPYDTSDYGFRVTPGGRGRVYGPYVPASLLLNYPGKPERTGYLGDAKDGNPILYYRSTVASGSGAAPTTLFGTSNSALFVTTDNDAYTSSVAGYTVSPSLTSPSSGDKLKVEAFRRLLGASGTSNNLDSTSAIPHAQTYLLVSPGTAIDPQSTKARYFTGDGVVNTP